MQSSKITENEFCEIKQINQKSLKQLLEANNWELSLHEYLLSNSNCNNKTFTCKNLNVNPGMQSIQIEDPAYILENKKCSKMSITFSAHGTRKIFTYLNVTNNECYDKLYRKLKNISEWNYYIMNHDDISNTQLQISYSLQSTYVQHVHSIYKLIKKCCDDISLEMWDKLITMLPLREKTPAELQLESNLEQQLKLLPITSSQESPICLQNIIDIATQLSAARQNQYIFYTIARDLTRLGFSEQAKEILTKTILLSDRTPFTEDAAALVSNIIMNNNSENKRKNAQNALQYALRSDIRSISDLKHKLSVLGICLGDETFFYHLLTDEKIACATEDCDEFETLAAGVFLQAIICMTETVYLYNQANKELRDENQQQREKINRLEAQLAQQNSHNNIISFSSNVILTPYVNHSDNTVTTEIENKTSLPSNSYL